jgi:TRAP-type C4-dicarboxylate transport system permease small subunit
MLFKIAIKNLLGAKLRTWLNVFVTALSFFMIILFSAMYDGMREHAKQVTIDTEIAGGAYWHRRPHHAGHYEGHSPRSEYC